MGNIYGNLFKVASFGESHGKAVGCIIDGCPPRLELSESDIQTELDKRRPGQSDISTPRNEADKCEILSGTFEGKTLGTPICVIVRNSDQHSSDYSEMADKYRPSHADYTYDAKFGIRDYRGGGRSSARETIARVIAGAVAKKCLSKSVKITAWVETVHSIGMLYAKETPSDADIQSSPVRCPDKTVSAKMVEFIKKAKSEGESVGGVIHCRISGVRAGLGEPVFDRLHAELAKAMLSIPAAKGFEIGAGFAAARLFGSKNNDIFYAENGVVKTKTNNAGGVLGGISSGMDIDFKIAFKPVATIVKEQDTIDNKLQPAKIRGRGRHDPCVLPRAVPIVEAMAAIVILNFEMEQSAREAAAKLY